MDILIEEVHDEIVFPLYDIALAFNDTDKDMLEYFHVESLIERFGYTTGTEMIINVRVDIFNIDALFEYFNYSTAYDIKNRVLTEYNKVYGN